VNHDQTPVHASGADDRSIARCFGYAAVDTPAGGSDKGAQFFEAAGVCQNIYSFPGRQFAAAVLALDMLDPAPQEIFS